MDITPRIPAGSQLINSYGDGGFTIAGTRHEGSVVVLPTGTTSWPLERWVDFDPAVLLERIASPVEILLIGCGKGFGLVTEAAKQAFRARSIGIDAMDTGAACRTYNVLLSEGRIVGAALIAV